MTEPARLDTRVMAGGAFDPLHVGHLAYLTAARALGPLTVAVAADAYIQAAKGRPAFLPQAERMALVAGLKVVDRVVAQDARGEAGALEDLRPLVYVKGSDWKDGLPFAERSACARLGIQPTFVETARDSSTARLSAYVQAVHEQGLAQLEALMASQTPAVKLWQPTAAVPYDFESRKAAEGIHPQLIQGVLEPTRVLDVGCGPGHLLGMLREIGVDGMGMDMNVWPGTGAVQWDIAAVPLMLVPLAVSLVDVVICREVLEHLTVRQIRRAVTNLCALTTRYVYLTTRFSADPAHLFDVQTSDDLDPTHISLLPQTFLRALFVLEGFKRRADLETRMDWQHKGRVLVYERAS